MQSGISMLKEDERRLIVRIALPSMLANVSASVCVLLDALLLSRSGTQASAAVSVGFPALTLIQTVGFTLGTGAGSFVSRSLGGGRTREALLISSTAFFLALFLSLALGAAGFAFSPALARMLGAADDLAAPSALYMRFVFCAAPLLCMNLTLSSILRALGRTKANMIAFGVGAAVGAALQALLIARLDFGISGSGAAMLAREGVTLVLLFYLLYRHDRRFRPRPGLFAPTRSVLADIMRSGLPTLLRQGLMSVSAALLSRVSAAFGEAALAGMGLTVRAVSLVSSAVIGFGQGFQPVCGFAYGAGDYARIRRAYRFSMACVCFSLLALGAAVFCFAAPLLSLFSSAPDVAAFTQKALRVQSIVFFAQGAVIMMNMLTQSAGFTLRASVIATSRQGFVFIPLLLLLPRFLGETGLLIAQSLSDLLSLFLCYLLSRRCLGDASRVTRFSCGRCGCSDARTASQ